MRILTERVVCYFSPEDRAALRLFARKINVDSESIALRVLMRRVLGYAETKRDSVAGDAPYTRGPGVPTLSR